MNEEETRGEKSIMIDLFNYYVVIELERESYLSSIFEYKAIFVAFHVAIIWLFFRRGRIIFLKSVSVHNNIFTYFIRVMLQLSVDEYCLYGLSIPIYT